MPACAAMSSRLVAANPLRANASVAAARICSRRCARGRRRSGSGFSPATTTLHLFVDFLVYLDLCLCSSTQLLKASLSDARGQLAALEGGAEHQRMPPEGSLG